MPFGISTKTIVSIAGLAGVVVAFISLGGAGGIGSRIGRGLNDFGASIIGGITGAGSGVTDFFTNVSEEQIVNSGDLSSFFLNVPEGGGVGEISARNQGLLTFGQFLKDRGLDAKIDFQGGAFVNQFTRQPLGFTINQTGQIKTGRIGLSDHVLQLQSALSGKFGIPTFDIKGNLSTFAGLVTGK